MFENMAMFENILVTNDDGVDADGLAALVQSARHAFPSARIIVAAPDGPRSECSHSVRTGGPIKVSRVKDDWFSIAGTPVNCVRVALSTLIPDADLVLSGINAGANLGVDLLVSGTVAAAREASLWNRAAIAISQYRRPEWPRDTDHMSPWLQPIFRSFAETVREDRVPDASVSDRQRSNRDASDDSEIARGPLWNVNLPAVMTDDAVPPISFCSVDPNPIPSVPSIRDDHYVAEVDFHGRPRDPGSDVDRCFGGEITITRLSGWPFHRE